MADEINTPENTMTPLTPLNSNASNGTPNSLNNTGDLEDIMWQMINLNDQNVMHEPTCAICSCAHREEVEKKFLENPSSPNCLEETKKVFKTKSNIVISNDIVVNHMRHHYDKGVKELQKIEYVNKIKRLNSVELTTLDRIRGSLSAIEERMLGINSIIPSGDVSVIEIEKIKSAETSKLMMSKVQLLKLQASIMGEMKNNGELIIIPRQSFVSIFNTAIAQAQNNEERELIKRLLMNLADQNKKTQ